jgi:transposase-like protein
MAKYSYEFKLQVVQAYLDGEGGYRYLSKNMEYLQKGILKNGYLHIKRLEKMV